MPAPLMDLLAQRGVDVRACLLGVVKEECGACEAALPLLDAAVDAALGAAPPVLVVVQEDAAGVERVRAGMAPATPLHGEDEPYALSRALDTEFTPSFWRVQDGVVVDLVEGFDAQGLHRVLHDLTVARGGPPFLLYAPGEEVPRFKPG